MHPRARQLIDTLALSPHPEGGWYRQVFKSEERVTRHADRAERPALTTIYFLLVEGTFSAWHCVQSDEVWHFYEGDPLELLTGAVIPSEVEGPHPHSRTKPPLTARGPSTDARDDTIVTRLDADHRVHVVQAREWQAARPLGAYTLVGCTVGPGFEFDDFEMKPGPI